MVDSARFTWPAEGNIALEHRFTRDRVGYYYRPGTSGRAIVLIHGMGGSSFHWRRTLRLLPAEAPLIVVDLPWCGSSRKYHGSESMGGLVGAVASCIIDARLGPVVIASHSIGSFFAWALSMRGDVSVTGLVLVSGQLFSVGNILNALASTDDLRLRISLADAFARASVKPPRFLCQAVDNSNIILRMVMWPMLNSDLIEADVPVSECFYNTGGLAAWRMVRAGREMNLLQLAENCSTPTTIIYGARDPLLTLTDNETIRRLPNVVSVTRIPEGRHFPIIETPEIVSTAIIDRLSYRSSTVTLTGAP
jgi:pimeloyl-ACP methyl ester carboxylesterase